MKPNPTVIRADEKPTVATSKAMAVRTGLKAGDECRPLRCSRCKSHESYLECKLGIKKV